MSESHELLNIGELNTIRITCGNCHTIIVVTIEIITNRGLPDDRWKCPICFDEAKHLPGVLRAYRDFHQAVSKSDLQIDFQVDRGDPKS